MSVARFLCPHLFDVTLRAPQYPVDQKSVGVSADLSLKILVTNPMRVVAKVWPRSNTLLRLERAISICCLTPRRSARSVAKRMPTSARVSLRSRCYRPSPPTASSLSPPPKPPRQRVPR